MSDFLAAAFKEVLEAQVANFMLRGAELWPRRIVILVVSSFLRKSETLFRVLRSLFAQMSILRLKNASKETTILKATSNWVFVSRP